eukprot:gene18486-biopygen5425
MCSLLQIKAIFSPDPGLAGTLWARDNVDEPDIRHLSWAFPHTYTTSPQRISARRSACPFCFVLRAPMPVKSGRKADAVTADHWTERGDTYVCNYTGSVRRPSGAQHHRAEGARRHPTQSVTQRPTQPLRSRPQENTVRMRHVVRWEDG